MGKIRTCCAICSILILALIWEPVLLAQDAAQQANATATQQAQTDFQPASSSVPIPAQIRAAKTVFISNAGDTTTLFPDDYSGGPDRPYVQFYAAMKQWARYQLVSSPDQADLVLEIGISDPQSVQSGTRNDTFVTNDPQLRLNILDAKTRVSLWKLTSHIPTTIALKAGRDKQFDTAMNQLVEEMKELSTQTTTTANSSLLGQRRHGKGGVILFSVLIGAAVIGGVAGFIAVHNSESHQPTLPPSPPQQYPGMHFSLLHH